MHSTQPIQRFEIAYDKDLVAPLPRFYPLSSLSNFQSYLSLSFPLPVISWVNIVYILHHFGLRSWGTINL